MNEFNHISIFAIESFLESACSKSVSSLTQIVKLKDMIIVSDKAKERILELKKEEGRSENENIRVSVKGGGCSGLMYDLGFDATLTDSDHVFEDKGVKILVDRKSLLYLAGTVLEFSDGLNGKGFQFVNPNASRTCGCGESFSV
jgi:iron-sulfur cluster assembly protein